MEVVRAVQHQLGYLWGESIQAIATGLGIHVVEVEEMASFYAFLNRVPKGRFHIRLSKSPVSMMKGATEVAIALSEATGAPIGGTSPDGDFRLEWTSDIGMADQEPSALINGVVLTELAPSDAIGIIAALRKHRAPNSVPLFPGADVTGAALPKAGVAESLVTSGPAIFRQGVPPAAGLRAALAHHPKTSSRK